MTRGESTPVAASRNSSRASGTVSSCPAKSGIGWPGIYIERIDAAGQTLWAATISAPGRDIRRRLFSDHDGAYAFALEEAEVHGLALFDHADPGAPE